MKINQNDCFCTSYNTKIFKISRGFSLKLKPYNSVNLAFGRACLYEHFCPCQLYLKKPSEDQHIYHLDHLSVAILCDSYYVFRGLARGVSVVNFVLSEATSKWSKMCFFTIAETPQIYMKINQNDSFWASYNTKIFKTNRGFSS